MILGDIVRRKKEKAKLLAWSLKRDSRKNIILFETDYLSIVFILSTECSKSKHNKKNTQKQDSKPKILLKSFLHQGAY